MDKAIESALSRQLPYELFRILVAAELIPNKFPIPSKMQTLALLMEAGVKPQMFSSRGQCYIILTRGELVISEKASTFTLVFSRALKKLAREHASSNS